ncbi:ATP-binding protein [Ornithinimicrobium faecis]|uniref:DUF4143 domain-containing protein n=1 Tax=Ornithinimicrobium faecis TaxID=2934158 RepID=A0ABY4YYB0_9MICO|nr:MULTISPECIES: DUF4143 domain-containing protein [unclassified Ornithinimicrobium]USQ81774.1 DUF4143 domain-containing protein [Ornithinimicrobium sp. HY1793]
MTYQRRSVDDELDRLLPLAPAIALEGAKGVGKTGTARRRAHTTYFLDDPADLQSFQADPTSVRDAPGPVLLDEWQRYPSSWDVVRRWVDAGAPPGAVLLTGSASPRPGVDTHSGAGRILTRRMRPMALFERGLTTPTVSLAALLGGVSEVTGSTEVRAADYVEQIVESGFPGIRGAAAGLHRDLLDSYIAAVIDRDLDESGLRVRRTETVRRWLTAYAAASSTTTAYSKILDATTAGDGSQPAKTTTITYRDHLTRIFVLDPVPGWSPSANPFAPLQVSPKHQLVDPALAARLLGQSAVSLQAGRGRALMGALFESLATLSVRVAADRCQSRVGHLRTRPGDREIDLVVDGPEGQVLAIEVKWSRAIDDSDVRHLLWLRDKLGDDLVDTIVLTTGDRAYRRRDGVAVVPLALLGR